MAKETASTWDKIMNRLSLQNITRESNMPAFTNLEDMREIGDKEDEEKLQYTTPPHRPKGDDETGMTKFEQLQKVAADISLGPSSIIVSDSHPNDTTACKTQVITVIKTNNKMATDQTMPSGRHNVKEARSEMKKMSNAAPNSVCIKEGRASLAKSTREVSEPAPGPSKLDASTGSNSLLGNWSEDRRKKVIEMFTVVAYDAVTQKSQNTSIPMPDVPEDTDLAGKTAIDLNEKEENENAKVPLKGKEGQRVLAWQEVTEQSSKSEGLSEKDISREKAEGTVSMTDDSKVDNGQDVEPSSAASNGETPPTNEADGLGQDKVTKQRRVLDTMKKFFPPFRAKHK